MELIRLRGKRGMLIERMCTLTNIDTNSYLSLPKYHEVCMVSGMQRGGVLVSFRLRRKRGKLLGRECPHTTFDTNPNVLALKYQL